MIHDSEDEDDRDFLSRGSQSPTRRRNLPDERTDNRLHNGDGKGEAQKGRDRMEDVGDSSEEKQQQGDSPFRKLVPEQDHQQKRRQNQRQPIMERQLAEIPPQMQEMNLAKESKPRLIIDRIVLENFKSYAGRQEIGPFHDNFTSVVGPNGSGKSNLIESMLFIFGYNAAWMRLNRLHQLIHNSASMKDISRASVEVTFKKIIDGGEVPNSTFTLRRTVNKNSISKYYLDGRESSQTECKSRLKDEGIDLQNNRFLILQGEVETISQMKQKSGDRDKPGLLEYLEDIIGSNLFLDLINQSTEQYQLGEEKKHERGQMMKLVENDLKGLTRGKEEAIKFVKTEKRVYQCENILGQVRRTKAETRLRVQQEQLDKLEVERDRVVTEEKERMKLQAERVKEIKRTKDQKVSIERILEAQKEELNKQNMKDRNLTQEMEFKSEDTVKYRRKKEELERERQKIIDESKGLQEEIPKKRETLESKVQELQQVKAELALHDNPKLRERIKAAEGEARRNQVEVEMMQEKFQTLMRRLDKLQAESTDFATRIKDYGVKASKEEAILEELSRAGKEARRMHTALKDEMEAKRKERKEIRDETQKVDHSLRQFESDNKHKSDLNNMFSRIMNRKIPGVLGRLGDLGTTSREFDEIITTACNRLDNIVVKDYNAARAVIDFLKEERLGRASCIMLDKISDYGKYMYRQFSNLPNATRLFDEIKASSDEARTAFYFALQDTLYCKDSVRGMEYSMRDDKFRRRVISRKPEGRDGYIIYQPNGLMQGMIARRNGFVNKGGKARKDDDHSHEEALEIKKLQDRKIKLNEASAALERILSAKQKELENLENDGMQVEKERRDIERTITDLREEIRECKRHLQRQSEKNEKSSMTRASLEREAEDVGEQIKNLMKEQGRLKDQVDEAEEEQRKKEGDLVSQLRDHYKRAKKEYEKLEKDLEKSEAVLGSTEGRLLANGKQLADLDKKIIRLEKDVAQLRREQEEIERKATDIFETIAREQTRLKEVAETEKKLRIILEDDEKQVRESKKKIDKARQDVDFCLQECKREEHNLTETAMELKVMREKYTDIIRDYAFMENLEEIEKMQVFSRNDGPGRDAHISNNTSMLDTTLLNTSMESGVKNFPSDKILQTDVCGDLEEHEVETFMVFQDRLKEMLRVENEAMSKIEERNLTVIEEFRTKFGDYKEKFQAFETIRLEQQELKTKIDQLKSDRLRSFREGFGVINAKLKEVYQLLTRGGDAELELIDSLDPFSDGINFSVRPPKKSWKEINKLSGGEKTLSSLSLIFALHYYKPTPLYFMDQIDAALDFKNVSIVAEYIKKRTKNAQFIIISLRNHMFDLADKLVGVYKTFDKTKTIMFRPAKYLELKAEKKNKENGREEEDIDKTRKQYSSRQAVNLV